MPDYGPTLSISQEIHSEKYRGVGESFREAMTRVADALKDDEDHYHAFRDILLDMRFLPAGRVQSAMGSPRQVTPYNCLRDDTEIVTLEGVKRIDQCNPIETLLDADGNWVEAPVLYHGQQPVWGVKFTNGRKTKHVYTTDNHDWVVVDNEGFQAKIQTQNLKVGMIVPHVTAEKTSADMAVVHGLIYGDGCKTKDGGYVLHVCSEFDATYAILDQFDFPYSLTERGRLYYFFGVNAHIEYKRLPDPQVSPSYVTGFIRGLFLADGCLTKQPEYIITGTIDLFNWLVKYGPVGGFYVTGKSKLSPSTNFGERKRDTYNIRFDLRSIDQQDCLKGDYESYYKPVWRVAQVWNDWTSAKVYCPVVETTQSFVLANGLLTGNCFVSQTIEDSMEGIAESSKRAAQTMRLGGGIGYDFSTLRPRGALIRSLDSRSSGPVSFMGVFDAWCKTIASAGHRRGAQMGVLRVDHPDIEEFIEAKANTTRLTDFNLSVAVTDKFMDAVKSDSMFDLVFEGRAYKSIRARYLWDKILRHTWDWAEPGILFIDRMNRKNNLWYCETIAATNPCGEQPLPPDGACLLGSFNLTKYVVQKGMGVAIPGVSDGSAKATWFDYVRFAKDISVVVRAMDNVIDRAIYPLPEQETEAKNKRRMGLGVTGVANAIEALGHPYGSSRFITVLTYIMDTLRLQAYEASVKLAIEKGPFPLFDVKLLESEFAKNLPTYLKDLIREHGLRNSHLLSVAPTGTISLCADNVSSGIEPVFSYGYDRIIQTFDGPKVERVEDYGYRVFGVKGRTANELSVFDHVKVLNAASAFVDSACSKTCNVGDDVTWDEFKQVYMEAYEGGASGCTTFRAAGKRAGILTASAAEDVASPPEKELDEFVDEGGACYYDPTTGIRSCDG